MRIRLLAAGVAGVVYVLGSHWLMTRAPTLPWSALAIVGPMLALAAALAWQRGQRLLATAAGLATALFAVTTATLVAPVVVVPDNSLTRDVFVDFHRAMASGAAPALALFEAQSHRTDEVESVLAQSINCFGWG